MYYFGIQNNRFFQKNHKLLFKIYDIWIKYYCNYNFCLWFKLNAYEFWLFQKWFEFYGLIYCLSLSSLQRSLLVQGLHDYGS